MSYIGVEPKSGFIKADQEKITGQTTNYVNLTNSISTLDDVQIWVNYVIQDPSTLTLNSTTQVGLGDTLVSSDVVLVTYLGQSVATQSPPVGGVSNDMLAGSIANSKLANSSITLNGSAVSLGGSASVGQANEPCFHAYRPDSFLAIPNDTYTTVSVSNELFDVGSAFNTSNYRFTPQVAGKYFLYANVVWDGNINSQGGILIQKNQQFNSTDMRRNFNYATASSGVHVTGMFTANGSSDYFEYRLYQNSGSSVNITNQGNENYFGGFLVTTT